MAHLKIALVFLVLVLVSAASLPRAHAEKYFFLINTTEEDLEGVVTVPYMDEHRWRKEWSESLDKEVRIKDVRIVIVRAKSNEEIRRQLNNWMTPLPTDSSLPEVLGVAIYSHGTQMRLMNESEKFMLRLPTDIAETFSPIVGKFSNNARIIFFGCEVLWGQSEMTAQGSLESIAQSFGLKSGVVYANSAKGMDPATLLANPLNSDIKPGKRAAAFVTYVLWPFSVALLPALSRFYFNQGYLLKVENGRGSKIKQSHRKDATVF